MTYGRGMTTMQSNAERLQALTDAQPTDLLVSTMLVLDRRIADTQDTDDAEASGIVQRYAFNVLEQRHPDVDTIMDGFFGNETPEGIAFVRDHTYAELLACALNLIGAV